MQDLRVRFEHSERCRGELRAEREKREGKERERERGKERCLMNLLVLISGTHASLLSERGRGEAHRREPAGPGKEVPAKPRNE